MIEAIIYTVFSSWAIMLLLFFYENEKVKTAKKLWRMGRKDDARYYYPFIDELMEYEDFYR